MQFKLAFVVAVAAACQSYHSDRHTPSIASDTFLQTLPAEGALFNEESTDAVSALPGRFEY